MVATTLLASAVLAGVASGLPVGPRRIRYRRAAALAGAGWLASWAEFTAARVRPGPRTRAETTTMAVTSALIPPLAVGHFLRGQWRYRHVTAWPPPPAAVLFDRDGTLIRDVPYNGDPDQVEPMPGAAAATARLRAAGIRLGVVTNQSGGGPGPDHAGPAGRGQPAGR